MTDESSSLKDAAKEAAFEKFRKWFALRQFFRQRVVILTNPHALLNEVTDQKWLSPKQFAIQATLVASLITQAGCWALIKTFHVTTIHDQITEMITSDMKAKEGELNAIKAQSGTQADARSIEKDIAADIRDLKAYEISQDTERDLRVSALPIILLICSKLFSLLMGSESGQISSQSAYLYIVSASYLWLIVAQVAILNLSDTFFEPSIQIGFERLLSILWMFIAAPFASRTARLLRALGFRSMYFAQTFMRVDFCIGIFLFLAYTVIPLISSVYSSVRVGAWQSVTQ